MPTPRFTEVTKPLTDFTGCSLSPSGVTRDILHPDGTVVCPPESGNWTGWLCWVDDPGSRVDGEIPWRDPYRGYILHYNSVSHTRKITVYKEDPR